MGQFFAEPLPGKGKLKKTSAVPAITDGNGCYSLSGAVYTVYSDRGCSQRVGTLTTDGSGNSGTMELNEGSYYVKETTAPKGYQLDTQIHTLNVTTGGTAVLNVQDQPKVTDTLLEILKIDMELKDGIPQGAASLAGARFEWKYYAGYYTKENLPANPTRTWVTQTKAEKDSAGKTHYVTALSDAYKVSGDAFYTQGGKAILPLGTITVEEKQAPQGYLLEDAYLQASSGSQKLTGLYVTQITESGNNAVLTGANRYSVSDKVIRGGVKIQKRDLETKAAEAQGNAALENTKYAVVSLNSNPVLVNGKSYTNGQTVLTLTADASGLASTADNVLPFGHYKIEETDPPKGYLKDGARAVEFDITEHKKIVDLTGDAVSMHNQVIRGGVKIQKRDLETKEAQPQGGATLEGTEFSITNLSAHPVFVNNQLYEKGQVVLTIKTDQTGAVSTANNALPYGHYKIEETKPPKGYLSTTMEPMEFDISENGKIVDLSSEETSFYNQVIRGGVKIQKRDLETKKPEAQGGATLEHAEFSITTLSEYPVVVDGKTYSQGQSVVTIKTDQNGLASTEKDTLPYGHYKVEEIKAPEGYLKDGQMALPKKDLTITDTVSYHLVPGKEYKLTGTLMDKETGEPLLVDEKPVTSELTFTPEEAEGTVELSFTFDASALQGKTLVAFESVSYEGKEVAVHTDIEDEPQTIYFPEIGTQAICPETESQTAPPKKDLTITDTVSYRLVLGKEYKLTGTLMEKETGEPLLVDGKPITAEQIFTPEKEEGSVELSFTFDASALAGKTVVAFESVSYEGKEIAVHADIESVPQSIYFSEIGTKAICPETGSQMAPPKKELTITDTVSYHLVPGKEYQLTGTLMDKENGQPLQVDGKPITSELKFTPKEAEGSVELSFTFDASALKGKTIVAFESVSQEGKEIAVHADIDSPEQSIYFPEIGTTAKDGKDGDQEALAEKETQIIDTVAFKGLMVGEYTYCLVGTLMDQKTGKEVLADGKPVTAETTFRPETAEGTLDVPFTFDATGLGGHDVVVFEKLFVTGKNGKDENEAEVASHEDIEAKSQTIRLTEIPGTPEEPEEPKTPETPDVPKTGDTTNLWIPVAVLVAALVGIVVVIIRIRRKRF